MSTSSGALLKPGARDLVVYGAIVAVGLGLSGLVEWKVRIDMQTAIDQFRETSARELQHQADELANGFKPIDRHGKTIDGNARESIIQIYNNLRTNVTVSEVYIVPASLEPEKIDPETGSLETPILMFDDGVAAHQSDDGK